jgi:hypothetical protein
VTPTMFWEEYSSPLQPPVLKDKTAPRGPAPQGIFTEENLPHGLA